MNRNEKLIRNSIIYAIGNFASKILNFCLIPIYSAYLTAEDFGNVDLLITAASLIVPAITFQVIDAVYRYMLSASSERERNRIFTNGTIVYILGYLVFITGYLICSALWGLNNQLLYIAYIVIVFWFQYLQQICRGLRKNEIYAFTGIIVTLIQGCSNILFIVSLHMQSESLLLAPVIASLLGLIIILLKTNIMTMFNYHMISFEEIKRLLVFSIPLCAHSICWWVITASGTYILKFFSGSSYLSGIYAMANKFPQVMSMIDSIFFLSWQESAVEEYSSSDRDEFFSNIFNTYIQIQISIIIVLLPAINVYFSYFKTGDFAQSSAYIPLLLAANIISSALSFISIIFNVVKKTKNVGTSSFVAMIATVITSTITIPVLGIYGLILGKTTGFVIMLLIRQKEAITYIHIYLDKKKIYLFILMLLFSTVIYYKVPHQYTISCFLISALLMLIVNYKLMKKILKIFLNMMVKRDG